jgi:selenocysteine-specific elongation factor
MHLVMGTAGHIDHGKTTLVKALTGTDCDRLAEEKKRGITIELGFARLDLGDLGHGDVRLGVVDVPGHERFVKNMVAGAAGIDFVLLVIAADEGIMPQTREHLEICTLLGIRRGLVALTKTDMVEDDWLAMVREEVAAELEPTFLAGAPVIPVSAHTGAGLGELRAALAALAGEMGAHEALDVFRLPVDRVFTMKGFGTVVTGTLVSGQVALGEEVMAYPEGPRAKVRGLQSHSEQVERVGAGRRVAMNLQGLEVEDLNRGDVLARPGTLFPSAQWDVELTCLASSPRSLKHRKELHFHHGTREILARIHLYDREELKPGETTVCRLRFPSPLAGMAGDHVVLRSFSPLRTVAGGRVVNPVGRRVKRFSEGFELLKTLAGAREPAERCRLQLRLAGPEGLNLAELQALAAVAAKPLEKIMNDLGGKREAVLIDKDERRYVSGPLADELERGCLEHLAAFHKREPMKQGLGRGALASTWGAKLPERLFHVLLERMVRSGALVQEQDVLRLPEHKVSLAGDQEQLRAAVLEAYVGGGDRPPNQKDVLAELEVDAKGAAGVYRLLQEQGELVKIMEGMYFHAPVLQAIRDKVVGFLTEHGKMGAPDFKDLCGLTRKYAIPVLEWMDKEKITVRVGDHRQLRKGGQA